MIGGRERKQVFWDGNRVCKKKKKDFYKKKLNYINWKNIYPTTHTHSWLGWTRWVKTSKTCPNLMLLPFCGGKNLRRTKWARCIQHSGEFCHPNHYGKVYHMDNKKWVSATQKRSYPQSGLFPSNNFWRYPSLYKYTHTQ